MTTGMSIGLSITVALIGFAGGVAAAWWRTSKAGNITGHGPGPWRTAAGTGEASGSMLTRAIVARVGIWALPQSEVVYFNAEQDDEGRSLDPRFCYELHGNGDLPARWWSIGVYVAYHWAETPEHRYSYTSSNLARDANGDYVIRLSRDPQPGNWLPLGMRDGAVTLIARLYQPEPPAALHPEQVPLPSVRRTRWA